MNDAQLFVIFFSIVGFGWLGFSAGRAWEMPEYKSWHLPSIILFMLWSAGLFIAMALNLIRLVERNF